MKNYFYQIEFNDGRVVRREGISKKLAEGMYNSMVYEMILLEVHSVTWGPLP